MSVDFHPAEHLRRVWSRSKAFRYVLVLTLVYMLLRLAMHGAYLLMFNVSEDGEILTPYDLEIYLDAAERFRLGQDLYVQEELERIVSYQYAPSFALAFIPFLWLPLPAVIFVHTLLHIGAYVLLYICWGRIFHRLGLKRAGEMLVWTLPVWLVFSAFWGDLGYYNIYVILALLATLLFDAVLDERLGWSLLWLSIILQTKPYWAFAVLIPLFLGRRRFFLKLVSLAVVVYAAIAGATMLAVGPSYGWQQHVDYGRFVLNMSANFPWRGPDAPFLGYNHSIAQTVVYLLGVSPGTLRLATVIKVLLLVPLGVVSLRYLGRPVGRAERDAPRLSLDLVFALYLGAFIWLDVVWELFLGIAVFTYLLATLDSRAPKAWVWMVFLPYALVDLWQAISYAAFGEDVVTYDGYFLTDPSTYVPLTMIVILLFYGLLIRRLWSPALSAGTEMRS